MAYIETGGGGYWPSPAASGGSYNPYTTISVAPYSGAGAGAPSPVDPNGDNGLDEEQKRRREMQMREMQANSMRGPVGYGFFPPDQPQAGGYMYNGQQGQHSWFSDQPARPLQDMAPQPQAQGFQTPQSQGNYGQSPSAPNSSKYDKMAETGLPYMNSNGKVAGPQGNQGNQDSHWNAVADANAAKQGKKTSGTDLNSRFDKMNPQTPAQANGQLSQAQTGGPKWGGVTDPSTWSGPAVPSLAWKRDGYSFAEVARNGAGEGETGYAWGVGGNKPRPKGYASFIDTEFGNKEVPAVSGYYFWNGRYYPIGGIGNPNSQVSGTYAHSYGSGGGYWGGGGGGGGSRYKPNGTYQNELVSWKYG